MKNKTNAAVVLGSILAVTFAVAMWSPAVSQPADPKPNMAKMEGCQAIMDQKKQMNADMTSQDAELTAHVAKMNGTAASGKTEEIAALLTHLVSQKVAMDARMAKMDEAMMNHMMKHMAMGKDAMAGCPMMDGMGAMEGMKDMGGMKHK
jgi:hypothetical protein